MVRPPSPANVVLRRELRPALLIWVYREVKDLGATRCTESERASKRAHVRLRDYETIFSWFHRSVWNDSVNARAQFFGPERNHRFFMSAAGHPHGAKLS